MILGQRLAVVADALPVQAAQSAHHDRVGIQRQGLIQCRAPVLTEVLVRLPKPGPRLSLIRVRVHGGLEGPRRQGPFVHQRQSAPEGDEASRLGGVELGQGQGGAQRLENGTILRVQLRGGLEVGHRGVDVQQREQESQAILRGGVLRREQQLILQRGAFGFDIPAFVLDMREARIGLRQGMDLNGGLKRLQGWVGLIRLQVSLSKRQPALRRQARSTP